MRRGERRRPRHKQRGPQSRHEPCRSPPASGPRRDGRTRGPTTRRPDRRGGRPGRTAGPRARRPGHRLGQVRGLLGRHVGLARRRQGAHADRLAAAGADARPGQRRGAGRPARGHRQLHQPRRLGRGLRRYRQGPPGRAAGLARAARQRGFRTSPAGSHRRDRPGGDRRGALHLRLGLRLPPRLPAPGQDAGRHRRRHVGAGHHRHRQQPRHGRHRPPARPAHPDLPRLARAVVPAPGGGPRARSLGTLCLGRRCAGRVRGFRHRLCPHGRGNGTPGGLPAVLRLRGGGLPRRPGDGGAPADRGRAACQRAEGRRRDLGAGHGL